MDYTEKAMRYLSWERQQIQRQIPPGSAITLTWREGLYIGSIQQIVPDYDASIYLLSKNVERWSADFVETVTRLDEGRLILSADDSLDLDGRLSVVRREGNTLHELNGQQTEFMERLIITGLDQSGQVHIVEHIG